MWEWILFEKELVIGLLVIAVSVAIFVYQQRPAKGGYHKKKGS